MERKDSMDTILTFQRKDDLDNLSDWSVEWSTTHVPGMDTATGGGGTSRRRKTGRRRLRLAALTLGGVLTMHSRVPAAALTGGYFIFMLLLIVAVWVVGNCVRHFEVYLGQWSISGPGRAFRIIPMFDGLGIAICINAILRAVLSVSMAAIAAVYVINAASDKTLPFTVCRDMDLKAYNGQIKYVDVDTTMGIIENYDEELALRTTLVYDEFIYRRAFNSPNTHIERPRDERLKGTVHLRRSYLLCKETYSTAYPPVYKTPPYNYFYVEVVHYRTDHDVTKFNMTLIYLIMAIWALIWLIMTVEKISYGRIIWNNMPPWLCIVPLAWSCLVLGIGLMKFLKRKKPFRNVFTVGGEKEVLNVCQQLAVQYPFHNFTEYGGDGDWSIVAGIGTASLLGSFIGYFIRGVADAIVSALYIHASGLGSEIIHGKGLNHYASGHIDHNLHNEIFWHSAALLVLTGISSGGAEICALSDYMQMSGVNEMGESSLWIFAMYSKCASDYGDYRHLTSAVIFTGLCFSYGTVAFVCLKTALHTVFEYRVTLVFCEQIIVAALMLSCMAMSVPFATNAGIALLESLDIMMASIATPLICLLEMIGMIYVYRSHDFISDIHVATEENVCSSRISILWSAIPFLLLGSLVIKCVMLYSAEMPSTFMWIASGGVFCMVVAMPLRAAHNAIVYLRPPKAR